MDHGRTGASCKPENRCISGSGEGSRTSSSDILETKLPAPFASQIDGLLSAGGDVARKIGGLFG